MYYSNGILALLFGSGFVVHAHVGTPLQTPYTTSGEYISCESYNPNSNTPPTQPITCISGDAVRPARRSGIALEAADPEVQDFVAQVNLRITEFSSGNIPTETQALNDSKYPNAAQLLQSLHVVGLENPISRIRPQGQIDEAFLAKSLDALRTMDEEANRLRANQKIASEQRQAAEQEKTEALEKSSEELRISDNQKHQWKTGTLDKHAVFSFKGISLGETMARVQLHLMSVAVPSRMHEGVTLVMSVPTPELPYKIGTFTVVCKNGKVAAMSYDFSVEEAKGIEDTMFRTYGPPEVSRTIPWQNSMGGVIQSAQMQWFIPGGLLEFDQYYNRVDQGRVMINPGVVSALNSPDKF